MFVCVCYSVPVFLCCDTGCRSWDLLDWDKNKGGARCSDTWEYGVGAAEGEAARPRRKVPQPPETGA